jgi:hypothetical protein
MTAQVIPLRQYDQKPKVLKKPLDLSYEIAFAKNLTPWLIVGSVLGLILPYYVICIGLVAWLYVDGKLKKKELPK